MTKHADRDHSEAYWPPAAAAAYDEPVPYVPTEPDAARADLLGSFVDQSKRLAKAERALADERAKVARVEALAEYDPPRGYSAHDIRAALAEPEPCPHTCSCTSDMECPHDCPCDQETK